jgi:spore coat protein U domain-containing protein, fimbrial subunit CupE1/2/3/6
LKKIIILLLAMAFIFAATPVFAESTTQNLRVITYVAKACRITSITNVAFSTSYDPTDTSPNDSGRGSFTLRCTRNTNYDLFIAGTRQMTNGSNNLDYELYREAARINVWPSASPGVTGTATNNQPVTRDIYGRISAGQDVQAGVYFDTVTITVQY